MKFVTQRIKVVLYITKENVFEIQLFGLVGKYTFQEIKYPKALLIILLKSEAGIGLLTSDLIVPKQRQ